MLLHSSFRNFSLFVVVLVGFFGITACNFGRTETETTSSFPVNLWAVPGVWLN